MKKRILCLLFAAVLLFPALAEGFLFDGAFTWNTTPEQAAAWLGEGAEVYNYSMGDYGEESYVTRDADMTFLGLSCNAARVAYYDGHPFRVWLTFDCDAQTLANALLKDYGEPEYAKDKKPMSLTDFFGDDDTLYCSWQTDEVTHMDVYALDVNVCGVNIYNAEVQDLYDRAFSGFGDMED